MVTVDLEEGAQSNSRVAAAEAVYFETREGAIDVESDQLRISPNIDGSRDDGGLPGQTRAEVAALGVRARIEPVVAVCGPGRHGRPAKPPTLPERKKAVLQVRE